MRLCTNSSSSLWHVRKSKCFGEADDKPIGNVGVNLGAGAYTLTNTDAQTGLAKLDGSVRGVKPDTYTVAFPKGIDHCEIVEPTDILVEDDSNRTFLFHIRKFYVSFQLTDQFDVRRFPGSIGCCVTLKIN